VHRVSHASVTFIVLAVVVVLFVWNVVPVELVAVGAALTLYATGVFATATCEVSSMIPEPSGRGRYWDRTSDPCRVKAVLSR
jgi:hypothetical protein